MSKVQQQQSKKYRNRKPKVKQIINTSQNRPQIQPTQDEQYGQKQLNGKPTIDESHLEIAIPEELSQKLTDSKLRERLSLDRSVEETAQILEQTSQLSMIQKLEEKPTIDESMQPTQIPPEPSLAIIPKSEESLTIDKSSQKTQIQQDERKKYKTRKSKKLKNMLKEFLENN